MNLFQQKPENLFNKVIDFLKNVESINCGGCGVAALALYDAAVLEGKTPKIVYLYHPFWSWGEREINEEVMRGKREKAESCWHIVVEIDGKHYHADGEIDSSSEVEHMLHYQKHIVEREMLINSLTNGGWNSSFDRKKWVPKIKDMIGLDVEIPIEHIGGGRYQ